MRDNDCSDLSFILRDAYILNTFATVYYDPILEMADHPARDKTFRALNKARAEALGLPTPKVLYSNVGNITVGQLQKDISHNLENPFNFWIDDANLYLANQDGLYIINLDGDLIYSINQKFQDSLKVFNSNNQYYLSDSKNLYTLIE